MGSTKRRRKRTAFYRKRRNTICLYREQHMVSFKRNRKRVDTSRKVKNGADVSSTIHQPCFYISTTSASFSKRSDSGSHKAA